MAGGFSIRGYAESLRRTGAAELGPFSSATKELAPLEVRAFRWWEDELASIKAAEAEKGAVAGVDEEEEEEEASGNGRAPKKRSITDLFAEAPAVGTGSGPDAVVDEEEVLRSIVRRSKDLRRKRRLEQAASAAADEPETSAAGERSAAEGNFPRKKSVDKPSLGDELDTSGPSKEHENDDLSTEKEMIPDLKRRKHGRLSNSLQKKKAERLKYLESRKAAKVGKQRDIKKVLPLHSILKKYTKHTSVKMVKEKHGSSKGPGVIQLCRKSVKRVKFSEMDDTKKQCSKRPPLESICELLSAITSSSSSLEMSSEEEHVIAESSSSRMPRKAFTMAKEANENTNHDNQYELSSTGLSTCLLDLNQTLPEPTDLNDPYVPSSDVSYLEHTEVGTWHVGQQLTDNGRTNDKESSFDLHEQEQQRHATELDTRSKGKSPCTLPNHFQDSVHLQQNWCSMTLHRGVSHLSTGGEPSSFQFRGSNLSHSEKRNFHSEMNVQQESSPAGRTLRLMGHDLTVSNTRVDYVSDAAQNHTNPTADHLTTKVVLELPRQGQPFLSLQTQSIPSVSASSANAVTHVSSSSASAVAHVSASSASTAQVHFGYRTPHNVSHPLFTANVLSGDPSVYEDRCRDFTNLQSHRNSLLGYPPLSNHGGAAFLQNSPPWRYYSDHSTRTDSPSVPFTPTMMQHVATSSDYRANLPHQSYGVYSASSTVQPRSSASLTCPNQIVQGVDSRVCANLPSRSPGTGTTRAAPDNSNTSSSSRFVLRSGPVKLSAGAKHILIPNENTEDDNFAPMYSCVSFGSSGGNVSAAHQNKGAGSRRF
ncbi:unnamed protein product [Miscanthus lutarioriparius]|uniref:Uncharacterized protein n=1 Tax=Miscanthus lutarioriparius TaxID=422564 RepID=A0A811PJN9_9POAL|nr:unnamed protein product [Miscanthus lutarioriparius]